MAGDLVKPATTEAPPMTAYAAELAKTRDDIVALESLSRLRPSDLEKRVRLAYRQFHRASLTGLEADYKEVKQTLAALIHEFGPKEDVCLLKANLDGRFHCLAGVKEDLQMCPALAGRFEGRSILADVDFQEGRYEQARTGFEQLLEENRTWDNLARLAHWHSKLGEYEQAEQLYSAAEEELTAKEMRSFAWLELQRGAMALARGLLAKAKAHYERAEAAYPGHWQTGEHQVALLAAEEKLSDAVALMESVVARAPKPELKQALGELLQAAGRVEEADPWLAAAEAEYLASAREGAVHYYHHLADFYADAGDQPAQAVQWARKDVALRSNFSTQAALAWALFQNGELAEGQEWICLALSSGVRDGGIYGTASALFQAAGDTIQGQRYARAAAEINPHGHHFHLHH